MTKKKGYKPRVIGTASFANGRNFLIEQMNSNGGCQITRTDTYPIGMSRARSIQKAWANVRYQAGVIHKTERTADEGV